MKIISICIILFLLLRPIRIEERTSPAQDQFCKCGKFVYIDKREKKCGYCILKEFLEGNWKLPEVHKIGLDEAHDGIEQYRRRRSSP